MVGLGGLGPTLLRSAVTPQCKVSVRTSTYWLTGSNPHAAEWSVYGVVAHTGFEPVLPP